MSLNAGLKRRLLLGFMFLTIGGSICTRPLSAQETSGEITRESLGKVAGQMMREALSNSRLAPTEDAVRRADRAAGRFRRVQLPQFFRQLKGRFIEPSGKVIWPRVIVVLVFFLLLWRLL